MRSRLKAAGVLALFAMVAGSLGSIPVAADHNEDDHSKNLIQKARKQIKITKDLSGQGSDLAFKRKFVYAGSYQGPSIWKITKRKPWIKQLGTLVCNGGQGDVSITGNHLIVSVDSPRAGRSCSPDDTGAATQAQYAAGDVAEGLRIVNVKNPRRPRQVKFVDMPCGSHTHTLLPGRKTSYIYVQSYPLGNQPADCTVASHRKVQIVKFPTNNPAKAKLLDKTIDVTPVIGCHEMTTFPKKKLIFGACINESRIWDISESPTEPELLATIHNPDIQIHHSTAVTWDGKYLILGDEYGGAAGGGGCTGDENSTVGAAWIYDITDPTDPVNVGHHSLPRVPDPPDDDREAQNFRCTNHLFNVIPMKNPKKYLMANSYYMGGIAVINFSDPTDPTEIGHYVHKPEGIQPDTWAAYWYNGRIYTNDHLSNLGVGVYSFKGAKRRQTHYFRKTPLNPNGEFNPQVQIKSWK